MIEGPTRGFSGLRLTLFLLVVVAAVNVLALWGILAARHGALESARNELSLETAAHARSLEAVLASLRGDLVFLSQSSPLERYLQVTESQDPLVRRWSRLDVEGSLLLFLEAHDAVRRLAVRNGAGETLVVAGRPHGAPTILAPDAPDSEASGLPRSWRSTFPLGAPGSGSGSLEVQIQPRDLLDIAAPGLADRLELVDRETELERDVPTRSEDPELVARAAFADAKWSPPIRGSLVRRETESRLVSSVESLAGRYRTTVILYSLVMTLTLVLGTVALRQTRRAALLEAARRHEIRVSELERQLFHNERLASLGRVAAGLAHEINNPLEGMANYLSLLEDDLRDGNTDGGTERVARLRQGLERAAGAVRQVLTFADPAQTPKETLDLGAVLAQAVDFIRANPQFRHVAVRFETPAKALRVDGHRVTLGQLFLNLLLNACQVQPEGGEVEVRATAEADRVRVVIADRGPGLPAELGGRIFEPFVSTRSSSGLGLSVCHGIAEDHRGAVSARDRENGGAEFEVTLPRAGDRTEAANQACSSAPDPTGAIAPDTGTSAGTEPALARGNP